MKKRELILDFTSLLDVIMILLFIVISNMAKASASRSEDAAQSLAEAEAQLEALAEEREELLEQLAQEQKNGEELSKTTAELQELQLKYHELQKEYDYFKITSEFEEDDLSVYELAMERMTRVVLICETGINPETGNNQVKINIYQSNEGTGEHTLVNSVTLEHHLEMTREERAKLKAEQIIDVTGAFTEVLRENEKDILWFSVQYNYDDVNFSKTDLDVIAEAVNNLERRFGKVCFTEEIKMYREDER
ncbi:MAG: hypothetical protein ACI4HQ_03980 [Acetatifactor sp.]